MYERDHLHAKAIKYGDPILMNNYRKLRNRITSEIEKKQFEHFSKMNNECKPNPQKIWEELKSVLPDKINFKSIQKNLTADTFNRYFVEGPLNLNLTITGHFYAPWYNTYPFIAIYELKLLPSGNAISWPN